MTDLAVVEDTTVEAVLAEADTVAAVVVDGVEEEVEVISRTVDEVVEAVMEGVVNAIVSVLTRIYRIKTQRRCYYVKFRR
jgi:hypothetical protein